MHLSKNELIQKLQQPLPGYLSHKKMSTANRDEELLRFKENPEKAKKSAVLILLFHENDKLKVVFIRRSNYVGIHAGQIAFPGGRYEETDLTLENTALREIEEEIGIKSTQIEILGRLTDIYVPPSNFLISVFVGFLNEKPLFKPDEREVDEIIEVDVDDFYTENVIQVKEFDVPSNNYSVVAPYYKVKNADIWGASAMVMTELLDLIK
jgi:8-oxo-dGTP pyrophosphatase MutT (NUDIX family)